MTNWKFNIKIKYPKYPKWNYNRNIYFNPLEQETLFVFLYVQRKYNIENVVENIKIK